MEVGALAPERGGDVSSFARHADLVEDRELALQRRGDEPRAPRVVLRHRGVVRPHRTVPRAAQADLPHDVRELRPARREGAPHLLHLARILEVGILEVASALLPVVLERVARNAHRLDVVHRHEHAARRADRREALLGGTRRVEEARGDDEVHARPHERLRHGLHRTVVHHVVVVAVLAVVAHAGRLAPLCEQILVVEEPAAEAERRLALHDLHFLPRELRALRMRHAAPEVHRIDAEVTLNEVVHAEHRAARVAAHDLQHAALLAHGVGLPAAICPDGDVHVAGFDNAAAHERQVGAGDLLHVVREILCRTPHAVGQVRIHHHARLRARPHERERLRGGNRKHDGRDKRGSPVAAAQERGPPVAVAASCDSPVLAQHLQHLHLFPFNISAVQNCLDCP